MDTASEADVFVVGGGPAGLAAALAARQQGLRVLLADCARPPIDKACGEGLMPDSIAALRGLGVSLDDADTCSFRGIRFLGRDHTTEAGVALIGVASGSADAITEEGPAMCFRPAAALGQALAATDVSRYQAVHRATMRLPQFLGRSMLLMDKSAWLRRRALRAFSARPELFQRLLSIHVGERPLVSFCRDGLARLGWQLLTP